MEKQKKTKNTSDPLSLGPLESNSAGSHSPSWVAPFCRVGFQPQSLGQRRETVSGWCISLMETAWCAQKDAAWHGSAVTLALADWRQLLHSCFTTERPFLSRSQLTSRALCNHADGQRGRGNWTVFPLTVSVNCCCYCRASPQPTSSSASASIYTFCDVFSGELVPTALAVWFWQLRH